MWISVHVPSGLVWRIHSLAFMRLSQWRSAAITLLDTVISIGVGPALEPLAKSVKSHIADVGKNERLWVNVGKLMGHYVSFVHEFTFDKIWERFKEEFF
jgi:hypothetical protein